MLKLGDALSGWAPTEGDVLEPKTLLEAAWADIVGPQVAKNSYPARIVQDTLLISTRSSAWSHQLSLLSEHVLRAVHARIPAAGITQLRFKVGSLPQQPTRSAARSHRSAVRAPVTRGEPATAAAALERFRDDVERSDRTRRERGWRPCAGCGALCPPTAQRRCVACEAAAAEGRAAATARLLFEAPWLGFGGTARLIDGLQEEEYERIRSQLLTRWWRMLMQAVSAKRLSRDGRERIIASSYVLLQTRIPPEDILPATVRNALGDELHDLIYATERQTT
jgi:hypothetical protein